MQTQICVRRAKANVGGGSCCVKIWRPDCIYMAEGDPFIRERPEDFLSSRITIHHFPQPAGRTTFRAYHPSPTPPPPSSSIRYLFSSFSARFWRPTGVAPPPELLCNLARGVVCAINYSPKCALCYMDDYTHVAQDNKFRKPLYRIVAQQPRARLSLPSLPCLLLRLPTPRCSSAQQPSPTHPLKPTTRQQTRWFQLLYIFLIVGFSVGGESSLLLLLSSKQASPRAGCCSRILPPPSSSPTFTQKRDFGGGRGGGLVRWLPQYIQ